MPLHKCEIEKSFARIASTSYYAGAYVTLRFRSGDSSWRRITTLNEDVNHIMVHLSDGITSRSDEPVRANFTYLLCDLQVTRLHDS